MRVWNDRRYGPQWVGIVGRRSSNARPTDEPRAKLMRRAHDRDGVPPRAVAATMAEVSDNDDLQDTDAEESEEEENDGEVASVDDRNGWGLQDDGAGYIVNDGGLFCYEKYVSLTRR